MESHRPFFGFRRRFTSLAVWLGVTLCVFSCAPEVKPPQPPNFVVIFADDLGWGDLGSYGHPSIRTPNLDRLAAEGQRWTDFYAGSSVCSPSRAALLTGREPVRSGLFGFHSRVLFPGDPGGMPDSEVTLAEALEGLGYRSAIIGKWHLGDRAEHLPTRHGFDYWFGLPYSNDMDWTLPPERDVRVAAYFDPKIEYWNVPLHRSRRRDDTVSDEVLERPTDQSTLTRRYGDEAVAFIEEQAESREDAQPFFLYLAHSMVHTPLFRSAEFVGHSEGGIYGDVVEEIDDGVGRILAALESGGLAENTLIVFTSDNGPWTIFRQHGGSAGPLQGGKGTTWEGGMRVPALFWWPGTIRPEVVSGIGSVLDLLPTLVSLAGGPAPTQELDGVDLSATLLEGAPSARHTLAYYRQGQLYAFRRGRFKIHLVTEGEYGQSPEREEHVPALLYDLGSDPGERWDLSGERPDVVEHLLEDVERHRAALTRAEPIFDSEAEEPGG